jgi:hypothetical protein
MLFNLLIEIIYLNLAKINQINFGRNKIPLESYLIELDLEK